MGWFWEVLTHYKSTQEDQKSQDYASGTGNLVLNVCFQDEGMINRDLLLVKHNVVEYGGPRYAWAHVTVGAEIQGSVASEVYEIHEDGRGT